VFIAYTSTAEFSVFLALGWELPARVLDLYVEHLHFHNEEITRERMKLEKKNSLLEACRLWGIPVMATAEKAAMRDLILRGRPYSDEEREAIVRYCRVDVEETCGLLEAMTPSIKSVDPAFLKAALLRGRYMKAVAKMEANGIPMDAPLVARLQAHWVQIKARLISKVDEQVLCRTIATLAQKKGGVKDVQAVLGHSKPDITAEVYMQEIEESVKQTLDAIYAELTAKPKLVAVS
jgi:DNA polymerase-1